MRLALVLLRRNYMPNGNIRSGKHRLVSDVLPKHIGSLKDQFKIEERNMFLLRHPYLTEEEEQGHSRAINKQAKRIAAFKEIRYNTYKRKNFTMEDILGHLNTTKTWD